MGPRLTRPFFSRPSMEVAADLLGRIIVTGEWEDRVAVRITETEAYGGATDPASHAFRGLTPRNAVMFGPAGHLYLYFIYGMHWCANIVTGLPGEASAVLLRAGEVIDGVDTARRRGSAGVADPALASGPARLTKVLGLGAAQVSSAPNGGDLCAPASPMRLMGGTFAGPVNTVTGPRVGVSSAHDLPLRFSIAGEASVSQYRRHVRRTRLSSP
ncbi:DNA-3-methyladenine glycosylase [Nakamurella antarctica]|uniref:Putative 3-methyladenine DNA glycosylase n=1 Tax=Nakamurella antarctica TaxID=1902245 RepID=A0A3G8ZK54_9ACTN|nr:DNA-3-methyladenine glycosylase [Nakamurella antarctica]